MTDFVAYTHHNCDDQVKNVPLILPKVFEIIQPLETDFYGEDDDGKVVSEVKEHVEEGD